MGKHDSAVERMRYHLGATSRIFTIAYWIPHAHGGYEHVSPIHAFSRGILDSSHLMMYATGLPMDIREMFASRETILFSRVIGIVQPCVRPIMIEALPDLIAQSPYLLNCVLSTTDMVEPVTQMLRKAEAGWINVGPEESRAELSYSEFGVESLVSLLKSTIEAKKDDGIRRIFHEFTRSEPMEYAARFADCPEYMHNITAPNEALLQALHIGFTSRREVNQKAEEYLDAVTRSVGAVKATRKSLLRQWPFLRNNQQLILALDSLTWPFFRGGIRELAAKAGLSKAQTDLVVSAIYRSGYNSEVRIGDRDELNQALESPDVKAIMWLRSAELNAFTAGLVLLGCSTGQPTIRLNPALNKLRVSLIQISGCARGNGPHQNFKLRKLTDRLSSAMEEMIGGQVMSAIKKSPPGTALTLVSDLPIEWLKVDGMPIAIRYDVSRVPATPGNVMLAESSDSTRVLLGLRDFKEVLVVRSFTEDDPVAKDLEKAILSDSWKKGDLPSVNIVDIASVDEFVGVVNAFNGAVLIFDGHGTSDHETGVGSIVIGGKPVDVWELRERIHLPPIVLLSACDTYPADGSHGSCAVGLLALGAKTVLGTLLPINSRRGALFIARLLYRMTKFMPIATAGRRIGVDWRYFMSGMLRMTYASEIIDQFERDFRLTFLQNVRVKTNIDINSRNEKWMTLLVRRLAAAINRPARDVWAWLDTRLEMVDSLKYVLLGRPELVAVHEAAPEDAIASIPRKGAAILS